MSEFINIDNIFQQINHKNVTTWIDKLSFFHIFGLWVFAVLTFGTAYFYLQSDSSYLLNTIANKPVVSLRDTIYFSFVAATTTGFGDIVPLGYFKQIAILEVIFGLLLLAFVTSKLVSIKQDAILNEIYDLSFSEKLTKLRSSLLLFRQNLDRIITKIEDGSIRRREINTIYAYVSGFEDTLREMYTLIARPGDKEFIKNIDPVNTELLFISMINSFEKINELLNIIGQQRPEWKQDLSSKSIDACIILNENLFDKLNQSKKIRKDTLSDLNARKSYIITKIKNEFSARDSVTPLTKTEIILESPKIE
jgi:hypothetical protein